MPTASRAYQLLAPMVFASIDQFPETSKPIKPQQPVVLASYVSESSSSPETLKKNISVSIDVPQKLVHDLFGSPVKANSVATGDQSKFAQLQSEIVYKVRQVLPESTFQDRSPFPIAVNMIREPMAAKSQWLAGVKKFGMENWPSAAVLAIGFMLLTIVTRKPDLSPSVGDLDNDMGDYVSRSSDALDADNAMESGNAEVRLTQLIEKDPDAAAKVIEAWIRDAA